MPRLRSACVALLAAPVCLSPAAAQTVRVPFVRTAILQAAPGVSLGASLVVEDVPLAPGAPAALELFRFAAFAPGARVALHGPGGTDLVPAPDSLRFRGTVAGDPWSRAFLTVRANGNVRGLVVAGGRLWLFNDHLAGEAQPELQLRELDPERLGRDFACLTDGSLRPPAPTPARAASPVGLPAAPAGTAYHARVAIETDFEYFQLFGEPDAAADYAADLLAFSSGIYAAEVETDLTITFLSLWTTSSDPWTQSGAVCSLLQFGRYWNDNYGGEAGGDVYSVAHFLSGKNAGGGVAWVGVLCEGAFNYDHNGACPGLSPELDNYGGPYGFSGNLDGDFDPGSGQVVWDLVVASHEIGHNFNSPHTHCYDGIGGPDPVDMCYGSEPGCYSGPTELPCPNPGSGCGTLMSYCHLLEGGIANMAPSFGLGHPWGVDPERVPDRMHDFAVAAEANRPECLAPITLIFIGDFESGDTSDWDQTVN